MSSEDNATPAQMMRKQLDDAKGNGGMAALEALPPEPAGRLVQRMRDCADAAQPSDSGSNDTL